MNDKHLTGNIGLFYACYCLSRHNWNVMPTIRNAKGADIIIVSPDGEKFGVQVKTLSAEADIFLGKNYDAPTVDFWVILMNARKNGQPKAYVIPKKDIVAAVRRCEAGTNSSDFLVYHDTPKPNGDITYYICAKFLKDEQRHSYRDAWDSIQQQ